MTTALLLLALALLLVLTCGMFVAAEFAFVTVDRSQVDKAAAEGDATAAGVQRALRSLSTQLSGAQVGITATNLSIGFLAEPAIAELLRDPLEAAGVPEGAVGPIALTTSLVLSTILTMLIGELVPKNIALALPMATARATQAPMRAFTTAIRLADPGAQRRGQRHRPVVRHRAPGGAALGAQLDRAGVADPAQRRRRDARRGHRRADGEVRRVRHPHRRRDHDAAGPHPLARGERPRERGDRARPRDGALPVPRARRRGRRHRHRARQERRGAAGGGACRRPGSST